MKVHLAGWMQHKGENLVGQLTRREKFHPCAPTSVSKERLGRKRAAVQVTGGSFFKIKKYNLSLICSSCR